MKAEKLIQNFDFIRSKFKTHKDAHSGIEIVSPYMCIEEFESILTDFAEKHPNKEAMREAFAAGCDFVHYMNTSRTSIDFNEWYNQKHQDDES